MPAQERHRLSLDLNPAEKEMLYDLAKRSGDATIHDIFRRMLNFHCVVKNHVEGGGKIVFRHANGNEEVLVLINF